ncbi:Phox-like protein, partial [Linnemannia elongata AG-77]
IHVRKRYTDFVTLRAQLVETASGSIIRGMPKLPPKKVVGKFRPAFVEKRRRELEYFLEWVVAHPIMGDSPVVVQWF